MRIQGFEQVNEMHQDMLREIGNIGTGNAATVLSQMLGLEVKVTMPETKILPFGKVVDELGHPEQPTIAVVSQLTGEMNAVVLFLIPFDFASALTTAMLGQPTNCYADVDEMAISALVEVGNIVISSYVGSFSTFTGLKSDLSVPTGTVNMLGGVLNIAMLEVAYDANAMMVVPGKFILGDQLHQGAILMVPSMESLNVLIQKLESFCG